MKLIDFKESKQREVLADIARDLLNQAEKGNAEDVETILECLQHGYLDELNGYDFFGTEGWQHRFGLDE